MRITVLSLVAVLLLPCAAARADKPKTTGLKEGDSVRVETRGTVQKSSQAVPTPTAVFVTPPNPCAGSYFFEKDMERYKFQLEAAKLQPRIFRQPPPEAKTTYSIRVQGVEWELDIDDKFALLFEKQVGKQVTIVGTVQGKRVRVVSVNGLTLE